MQYILDQQPLSLYAYIIHHPKKKKKKKKMHSVQRQQQQQENSFILRAVLNCEEKTIYFILLKIAVLVGCEPGRNVVPDRGAWKEPERPATKAVNILHKPESRLVSVL